MSLKMNSFRDRTNHNTGSYAEYCLGKAGNAMVVPDNITDIQAATLGVATVTVVS
jgi:NADPH:quinone reductase-like Zn-dependent oxidoreductase